MVISEKFAYRIDNIYNNINMKELLILKLKSTQVTISQYNFINNNKQL